MVCPDILAAYNRRIDSEVLLHGTQATVLDRGAPLDDAGDRGGPTLGRLPKGVSHERARCLRDIHSSEKLIEGGEGKLDRLGGIAISKARDAKLDIWRVTSLLILCAAINSEKRPVPQPRSMTSAMSARSM